MKLTISIQMDNDAFQNAMEASQILHELAKYLETTIQSKSMDDGQGLVDSNGNTVGEWMISEDEEAS